MNFPVSIWLAQALLFGLIVGESNKMHQEGSYQDFLKWGLCIPLPGHISATLKDWAFLKEWFYLFNAFKS